MRETFTPNGKLRQRARETLNGCVLLGRKPGAVAKMALKRARHDTGVGSQRGNADTMIPILSRCT